MSQYYKKYMKKREEEKPSLRFSIYLDYKKAVNDDGEIDVHGFFKRILHYRGYDRK